MAVTDLADTATTPTTATPTVAPPADLDPSAVAEAPATSARPAPAAGDKVEVRRRLDDQWARGFEVIDVSGAGYRLRRLSDGVELPTTFAAADIRRERKRSTWWY